MKATLESDKISRFFVYSTILINGNFKIGFKIVP